MSLSSLLCEENNEHDVSHLSGKYYDDQSIFRVFDHENDEFVEILMSREINSSLIRAREVSNAGRNNLRDDVVNYFFNMREVLGFQFQTAFLSLSYFDFFLSKRSINDENTWAIQLLSVACLSLAAKLEEYKVPSLSEFQVGPYNFQAKIIQKMELLVLNTLEWKMGLATPLAYLPCFITKICQGPPPKGTIPRIIKLLLAFVKEINLMDHHQYAITCASILVALDQRLSRMTIESMIDPIPFSKNLNMDDIFTCYNIMKELLSPLDVLMASSSSSSRDNKRKRLEFDKIDVQNDDNTSQDVANK